MRPQVEKNVRPQNQLNKNLFRASSVSSSSIKTRHRHSLTFARTAQLTQFFTHTLVNFNSSNLATVLQLQIRSNLKSFKNLVLFIVDLLHDLLQNVKSRNFENFLGNGISRLTSSVESFSPSKKFLWVLKFPAVRGCIRGRWPHGFMQQEFLIKIGQEISFSKHILFCKITSVDQYWSKVCGVIFEISR